MPQGIPSSSFPARFYLQASQIPAPETRPDSPNRAA
jgi:hypothetical protein